MLSDLVCAIELHPTGGRAEPEVSVKESDISGQMPGAAEPRDTLLHPLQPSAQIAEPVIDVNFVCVFVNGSGSPKCAIL